MNNASFEKRFRGQARLARLHLWRVAKSTDIDECFRKANELRMISAADEEFLRKCLDASDSLETGDGLDDEFLSRELIERLESCILRLNSADPA